MTSNSQHVFISHTSADDDFVKELRIKLELHGISVWVDSQQLRGGSKLEADIEQAIKDSGHVIAVLSPRTINSPWVRKEIQFAEANGHKVIPLLLPGIEVTALGMWFDEEPVAEKIELDVGKLDEKLPHILAALGLRAPDHDLPSEQQVANKPVAELLLELSEPTLSRDEHGAEQLSARAELSYLPADMAVEREVKSRPFRFTAPIGQIEQDELHWYLEEYYRWPVGLFRERAERTEGQLAQWGAALFAGSLGNTVCQAPLNAWKQVRDGVERRFSVQVEATTLAEGKDAQANANEAASRLQSLPWELLYDEAYLSEGANPVGIRRRLPNFKQQLPRVTELPICILLVSPRPEEQGVSYIDHRVSALPLVQAVESLGDLVQLTVLSPPTLGALEQALHRARDAGQAYDVLHFDGHGIYDREHGLGALCFENPQDSKALEGRRNDLVHADTLAKLLKDFRVPLVFLEVCQTAQAEADPNASVAASLLEEGVTSVVAMTHSVLVETARRFVTEFYQALAQGQRVGAAMLAGQRVLMRDTQRGQIAGAGELHLQDWFVPILYKEQHDPQLFERIPSATAQQMQAQQQQSRLGWLGKHEYDFVGRSRELLQLERLLEHQSYAVIRGQGGAGKTTVAVELAQWLVRSRRFDRCAFVSVEEYTHAGAVVEVLLKQLLNPQHNLAAEYSSDIEQALQAIRRVLENERVLIVVDNVESLLAAALEENLAGIFGVLEGLAGAKLLFTTRESLPKPFNHKKREILLGALAPQDAKALVMQVMNHQGLNLRHDDQGNTPQEVEALVQSVGCHARALVLLARELALHGVTATTGTIRGIMQRLEAEHPGQRENSLFASVELSLQRLSSEVREQIAGLAVFQDGGKLEALAYVLDVDTDHARTIGMDLIQVGLAQTVGEYGYVRFDPALAAYLDLGLTDEQRAAYLARWRDVMGQLVGFLYQQIFKDTKLSFSLTQQELPNLMAYLQSLMTDLQAGQVTAEAVTDQLGRVEQLLANLNQPQALAQMVVWRGQAAQGLGEWSRQRFEHERMSIERLLQQGDVQAAFQAAQAVLEQCQQGGEQAYAGADYDLAMANVLLVRVLKTGGAAAQALPYLQEAQQRFEVLGEDGARMATVALADQGDCLLALGQLDAAVAVYEEAIVRSEKLEDTLQVAVGKASLATTRLLQNNTSEALEGYKEAMTIYQQLNDSGAVATAWHQMGMTHKAVGDFTQAEQAYRQSLSINSQQRNKAGEAKSLNELGILYDDWQRPEQAVSFYRQAVAIHVALGDLCSEGMARSNIAGTLITLQRYDEARPELLRAIECKQPYGHAAEPWKTWYILHNLEQASGNPQAAREAREQAVATYLAYRRDGGENHSGAGRFVLAVGQAIQQGDTSEVEQVIADALDNPEEDKNFLHKLQAIIAGERDLALAADEDLKYDLAVELQMLLEGLG
ncbi:TIR domain-containing protein [Leucothrix pacifica]|uniref:TIR domain-containing protein n=1 Tax=Leucothrix pacifica TaxID=1247513 RepID=A0A317C2N2_9GAMM|nr:TIR domain-containing protein [Leucothrix pacifica]PWQ92936.1 hypothetical protein DKW60_18680 [Leucothrix pacifica]